MLSASLHDDDDDDRVFFCNFGVIKLFISFLDLSTKLISIINIPIILLCILLLLKIENFHVTLLYKVESKVFLIFIDDL